MTFKIGDKVKRNTAIIQKIGQSRLKMDMVGSVVEVNSKYVVIEFYDKNYRQYARTCVQKRFLTLAPEQVTAKQIETKLEELKAPVTHARYAVLVDPVFDIRGEFNSYVTIHGGQNRTIFSTRERAELCAEQELKRTGSPHVVIQFISRFSNPPIPKTVKEEYT